MARAKRASDVTYNVRRRALRLAKRLEKQGLTSEAAQIRAQAAKTKQSYYGSKKEYQAQRTFAQAQLMETRAQMSRKQTVVSPQLRASENRRSTTFLHEIEQMRAGQENALINTRGLSQQVSALKGQLYENIFYRATRAIWYENDNPESAKYALENFMLAKGFENFEDAWQYVMNSQSDALQMVDEIIEKVQKGELPQESLYKLFHNSDGSTTDVYQDIAGLITDFL